jgi:hypothetical protein
MAAAFRILSTLFQSTKQLQNSDWLIPAGLIALSLVPTLRAIVRLVDVSGGVQTVENARFLAMPWPIALHILTP